MDDIVEIAARAIYESKLFQPARANDPWDGQFSATKAFCRAAAIDVLKAIREATPAMTAVADRRDYTEGMGMTDKVTPATAADLWRDMVDAALAE